MSQDVDVLVVGGGIVGLSAAIAMRMRGYSVAVMDAGLLTVDTTKPDLRVYALNKASHRLLQSFGVWSRMDQTRVSPYTHMHVWDAKSGTHIDFDARLAGVDRLGSMIDEAVIKQALLEQARALGTFLLSECRVMSLDHGLNDVCVHSTMAETWSTKLLIVADGAQSSTRELLGVSMTTWPYHQEAIIATVQTEQSHHQTAYQVFHTEGPLAFLPLVDQHQCSIVWSTSHPHAAKLMALSNEAFQQQLTDAFFAKLGIVTAVGNRCQFTLNMRHAQCYSGPRWLLMGDAAHTIHPLAGLGLNVGLADLAAWLAIFDADTHPLGSKKILGAYQRHRKYAVWQQIALMEGLKGLFANPFPPIVAIRAFGLNACNRLSPIKRLFIEHAAG